MMVILYLLLNSAHLDVITTEVITLVNSLARRSIRVIVLKQNLDISQQDINSKVTLTLFSLFSELERDLISLRTKEALASKKRHGQVLGKPKGTFLEKVIFGQKKMKIKSKSYWNMVFQYEILSVFGEYQPYCP